jgi:hypothetical protein
VIGWLSGLGKPVLAILAALVLLVAIPRVVAAVKHRPRSPLEVTAPAGLKRSTLAFYAHWLKECAGKGFVRARSETPREFLAKLPPELREGGARITEEFERRRYGPP